VTGPSGDWSDDDDGWAKVEKWLGVVSMRQPLMTTWSETGGVGVVHLKSTRHHEVPSTQDTVATGPVDGRPETTTWSW
jgi:hypothetical protein